MEMSYALKEKKKMIYKLVIQMIKDAKLGHSNSICELPRLIIMINLELVLAISSYYFVMFATPGPNNSILTASGIKFGFIRTIPNIFGIPLWSCLATNTSYSWFG